MKLVCLILSLLFSILCGNDLENNLDLFNETAYQFTYEMNLWETNSNWEVIETPHNITDSDIESATDLFIKFIK